jgi:hypothetical protein
MGILKKARRESLPSTYRLSSIEWIALLELGGCFKRSTLYCIKQEVLGSNYSEGVVV